MLFRSNLLLLLELVDSTNQRNHDLRHWVLTLLLQLASCREYESRVFPEIPDENAHFEGKDLKVTISRRLFDGFYREGFPMRMNIWSYDHPEIHWVEPKLWKSRLLHSDFNPAGAGWLILN